MTPSATQPGNHWVSEQRVASADRWDLLWQAFSREATQLLLRGVPPSAGRVLDLASGAGDPAVHIAKLLGPRAHVTATDLGRDILCLASRTAARMGINNLSFQEADAHSLPFPDRHFDVVTSRFGVMFFQNLAAALPEVWRVLRPSGIALFVVWGTPQQPYFAATVGSVLKLAAVPPPPSDAPHPFRFSQPGKLCRELEAAGFARVREQVCPITLCWPGPPSQLWQYFQETTGTYRPHLEGLGVTDLARVAGRAQAAFQEHFDGEAIRLPGEVLLVTGIRE